MTRSRGNLLVGQSGGATAVINASLVGVVRAALAEDTVGGIYGARHGIEGLLARDVVDLRAQPATLWDALMRTPSAALGSCPSDFLGLHRLRPFAGCRRARRPPAAGVQRSAVNPPLDHPWQILPQDQPNRGKGQPTVSSDFR